MHNTASRASRLCFTPQLISIALDVIWAICNHDVVLANRSLYGRELFGSRYLFLCCTVVDLISCVDRAVVCVIETDIVGGVVRSDNVDSPG